MSIYLYFKRFKNSIIMSISQEQLEFFKWLFTWRKDIYAYRREKNGKSWYSPAYNLDWYKFTAHKAKWWTIDTFQEKTMKPLTDYVLQSHLRWEKVIGIYPLLGNNTSHFIAADFDKENRIEECRKFISLCEQYWLPAYLERSRSWNGGHVRLFFEEPYLAIRSRKIFLELIRKSLGISQFEKEISFDRIFPNQDFLTKKWFWNLIALPLQWASVTNWNSVFIDPDSQIAYPNQWEFLEAIQRIPKQKLDDLYISLIDNSLFEKSEEKQGTPMQNEEGILNIILDNQILLPKFQLPIPILKFIKEELNFLNNQYLMKKALWRSTYTTNKYFNCIQEDEKYVILPRGFLDDLENFCIENAILYSIDDKREIWPSVNFDNNITLHEYQKIWLEPTHTEDFWVIVSPAGSWKTVMGLELVARKRQKTLIIVHRQQLFDQWIANIQKFLWIMKKDIWQIKGNKNSIGKKITVAMLQTLTKRNKTEDIHKEFWTIIIDECHHIPAKTFREAISNFHCHYMYGLTATPKRKNNDEKLIYTYIWPIISEIDMNPNKQDEDHQIIIRETDLFVSFDYKIDHYETISKVLVFDTARNNQIVKDILNEVKQQKRVLVLTERKEHIDVLSLYLKGQCEVLTLSWDDGQKNREMKIKLIQDGQFQVFISTGQLLWEWWDICNLQCLFLVYPFSFEGKLIQYIWRLQRSKTTNKIYDYRDNNIDYFERLFKKRYKYYRKLQSDNYQIREWDQGLFEWL